ncbi:MAG: NrsF family protein [Candidatus Binataceae bacterium]
MNRAMVTSQTQEIRYDALLGRAIEELRPVKRIWPVNVRLALWLLLELAVLAGIALTFPRADLYARLHNLHYLLVLGSFVVLGVVAASLALRTAIPGREASRLELTLVGGMALGAILVVSRGSFAINFSLGEFIRDGVPCMVCTGLWAALPWLMLFWAVRRAAPLSLNVAGGLIGAAAFAFAFAASRLACPIDGTLHILVWHVLPAAAGAGLSVLAGTAWLRKRRGPSLPGMRFSS